MIAHRALRRLAISSREGGEQCFVLIERLLGDAGMKHQAENMKMRMLVRNRLADQLIASKLKDAVVEDSVLARESGIANPLIAALPARHNACHLFQD